MNLKKFLPLIIILLLIIYGIFSSFKKKIQRFEQPLFNKHTD